jgi:hypothetical protein
LVVGPRPRLRADDRVEIREDRAHLRLAVRAFADHHEVRRVEEARTKPQAPFSSITRAPFTVTTRSIRRPPSAPPSAAAASIRATIRRERRTSARRGRRATSVGVDQVRGRARRRSDIERPGLRSRSLQISTATRIPSS